MSLTRPELTTLVNDQLPTNNLNQITAADLRATLEAMIGNLALTSEVTGAQTLRLSFTPTALTAFVPFNQRLEVLPAQPVRGVVGVSYQLLFPDGTAGLVRTTGSSITTDIAALSDTQVSAGYVLALTAVLQGGFSTGQALLPLVVG